MQNIGEGCLEVPEGWHNQSVNIFTAQSPGTPGVSITINRDRLPFQTSLDEYIQEQSGKLSRQLKGYKLIDECSVEIDGRPGHQFEFSWQTDDAGPIHQVLMCLANGEALLNLAASSGGSMNETQAAAVKRILHSFRFNAPPTAASEEPKPN
jgi:hypothetical protein